MGRGPATIALAATLAAALAATVACTPTQRNSEPPIQASPNAIRDTPRPAEVAWPYWPRSMRIHPLTRIVEDRDTGRTLIEARVEMRDGDGGTSKACGLLRLDLYDASNESPAGSRAEWNLDLRDRDFNHERFDDVTLTYLFRLEIGPEELPEHPVVWAYFLSDDGADLSARLELRPAGR